MIAGRPVMHPMMAPMLMSSLMMTPMHMASLMPMGWPTRDLDSNYNLWLNENPQLQEFQQTLQLPGLKESEEAFSINVPAAGIAPEDLKVSFTDGILRVVGETKGTRGGVDYHYLVERAVRLPVDKIDAGAIEATNDHGMLHVVVPKLHGPKAKPRLIPVRPARKQEEMIAEKK